MNINGVKQNGEIKQDNVIVSGGDTESGQAPKEIHKSFENEKDNQ